MRISVRVKTNARKNEVVKVDEQNFIVSVSVPPVDGRANVKVIELLAAYFHTPKRNMTILRGSSSHLKLVEIAKKEKLIG